MYYNPSQMKGSPTELDKSLGTPLYGFFLFIFLLIQWERGLVIPPTHGITKTLRPPCYKIRKIS